MLASSQTWDLDRSLVSAFEEAAQQYSARSAIWTPTETLSYAALNRAANRVAHAIHALRGSAPEPVVLVLEQGVAPAVVLMLGSLKAGKFFVALDPAQPAARLQVICDDAQPALIITSTRCLALAGQLAGTRCALLNLDDLPADLRDDNPGLVIAPDQPACINFTSGSTGQPKGVVNSHRTQLFRSLHRAQRTLVNADERQIVYQAWGTSWAMLIVFATLLRGATLYPLNLQALGLGPLTDFVIQHAITVFPLTPTLLRQWVATLPGADRERFPRLRVLDATGEPFFASDVALWRQHFAAGSILLGSFGITETGLLGLVEFDQQTPLPHEGEPLRYTIAAPGLLILREDGSRAAPDELGEILVRSPYLMSGYWRKPALTATKLLPDPEGGSLPVYASGDMGRISADGKLEMAGRKDFQAKVRGFLVQPAEIEQALLDLPEIREAVVLAHDDAGGGQRLTAYLVAGEQRLSVSQLRAALARVLPDYMLPALFMYLDRMPFTPIGKIDRRALPLPSSGRPQLDEVFVAPREPLEAQLAALWADLLGVGPVGIYDDFFELGGDSLLAMRLFATLAQRLGCKLPLSAMFQASTVAELAAQVRAAEAGPPAALCLVPIQARGTRRPFFLAAGGAGGDAELLVYARLARYLGTEQPFYGLRAPAVPVGRAPNLAVEAIAAGHVAEIRSIQPAGPYLLGGECVGGLVALEMARQLRAQGEQVALLCLLDTIRPTWRKRLAVRRSALAQRWRRALRLARSVRHPELRARPAPQDDSYSNATQRYRPRRTGAPLTLLINEEYHHADPTLGWDSLTPHLEVHPLPGTHDTYIRQNIQTTGERLRDCLERAQQ